MADDLGYTPGAGATVATDEVGGVHYQRMKVTLGADGDNDGDVSAANPMPVNAGYSESSDTLGTAIDSAVTVELNGATVVTFSCDSDTTGAVAVEMSPDGTSWFGARGSYDNSGTSDQTLSDLSDILIDGGGLNSWTAHVAGMRQARVRVTDTLGASRTINVTTAIGARQVDTIRLSSGARVGADLRVAGSAVTTGNPVPVAITAGTNNIGDVDIASIAAGDNNIGNVDVVSLPSLVAGTANIGDVDVLTLPAGTVAGASSLPAGTNNIGDVDVATLPNVTIGTMAALVAGSANIGDVDVLTLPAGTVAGASSLPAGTNNIGDVDVLTLPNVTIGTNAPLVAGTANIGDVDVLTLPSIPAGSNNIGDVDVLSLPTAMVDTDRLKAILYDADLAASAGLTALRDLLVAERYTQISDSLADGVATYWTQTAANGGTATSSGGEGLIQSNANATGSIQIVSPTMDYRPGQVNWLNSAVRLGDTGSAGNIRRWGAFTVSGTTPQDGYAYELNGTTLNAVVFKAGVATAVASTSWSKFATNPFTLTTNYTQFEIRYTANTVWFLINNAEVHRVSGTTTPLTTHLNFPITLQSINSSGASNRILAVRNIGMGGFGQRPATTQTSTTSTVAGSASSVQLLAHNGGRKGATVYNDSTALLYVKLGTTASTSDFTVKMQPDQYYEVPFDYVGKIDGIWASATGNARMTELV
jgi:hypothetical protein